MTTKQNTHKSKIGGQALIEGIMMRGIDNASMACRLPNGEIDLETWAINNGKTAPWYKKTPFVRGVVNFTVSMIDGYKCITKSAEKTTDLGDEELSPFEKKLEKLFGGNLMSAVTVVGVVLGVALAIGLFVFLPSLLIKLLSSAVDLGGWRTVLEGLLKIALFIGYMWVVSLMKDIKRTYEYHGAEHKTIACYEANEELIVENVAKHTRFHPRCGTSFIFLVLIISILVLSVFQVSWDNIFLRMIVKLALLPLVVGIAYEIIKLAGRYDNILTRIISAPGLWLQRLTTREPDASQIEIAIAALNAVIPADKEEDQW